MATPQEIEERTTTYGRFLMGDDWSAIEADAVASFRPHLGTLVAALRCHSSVDVSFVWRSGPEWHVETEVTGDDGARVLLLRYLDGSPPHDPRRRRSRTLGFNSFRRSSGARNAEQVLDDRALVLRTPGGSVFHVARCSGRWKSPVAIPGRPASATQP